MGPDLRCRRLHFCRFVENQLRLYGSFNVDIACDVLFPVIGRGIRFNQAVFQAHDTGRILIGKLRVMRDHDDEPLTRNFLDQLHDLDARLGVQRAGRFVCKQDIRVVDERTRNGNALHLPARELVGFLIQLVSEPDTLKRLFCTRLALLSAHARDGERKLYIPEYRLVWDEVIGLKDKSDTMIAVDIPVPVPEIFGRTTLNDKVTRRIVVKTADDIEKRRLAAARRAEHTDKLALTECKADAFESVNRSRRDFIFLCDP